MFIVCECVCEGVADADAREDVKRRMRLDAKPERYKRES